MTAIDEVRCMNCDYRSFETEGKDKCPDCGTPINNYYKSKIFAQTRESREALEEDSQ